MKDQCPYSPEHSIESEFPSAKTDFEDAQVTTVG